MQADAVADTTTTPILRPTVITVADPI